MLDKPYMKDCVIYISGKYRGNVADNIDKAQGWAKHFWMEGYPTICPHLNTAYFEEPSGEEFIAGDLRIISRLDPEKDIMFMLYGWEASEGARKEHKFAQECGLSIQYERLMGIET